MYDRISRIRSSFGGREGVLIVVGVLLYLFCLAFLAIIAWEIMADHSYRHRGIVYGTPPDIPQAAVNPFGVNVSLERYEGEDLDRALTMISDGGFQWIRQRFPWAEIEPERGEYRWEEWDRIVEAALERDLVIIAVLETSPLWARAPMDAETPQAPPRDFTDFADFARAFAAHYREQLNCYEIWDQPNLYPHWGERYTDPAAYTHLLQAGYRAVKEADPEALVLTAGLAPNVEEGGQFMSDILFLQEMYEAGAKRYFDILAIKPYGLWYEPEDRRVSPLDTNLSRPILLREVMLRHGDGDKAVWAVEFGWCALPTSWTGRPAPWTSDSEDKQARRTVDAIQRARDEWPWMGVMDLQHFHAVAEPDDPVQCFSLITDDFEPRLTYLQVQALATATPTAYVGWYPADTWAARYEGSWGKQGQVMSGARKGDQLVLPFKGTRLDLLVQPPFYLSEVTVDGEPANGLSQGSLRLEDGSGQRRIVIAKGLEDEEHVARLTVGHDASGGGIGGFIVMRESSFGPYYLSLLLLAGAGLVVVWRLGRLLLLPRPLEWWRILSGWYLCRETWQQVLLMAIVVGVYHFSPWTIVSLASLLVLIPVLYLRLDLGLAFTVLSIPFFLRPRIIVGQSLSLVEMLTVLCFATWLLRQVVQRGKLHVSHIGQPLSVARRLALGIWDLVSHLIRASSSLDFAILSFLALSVFSLTISENFGVSFYELRTVIIGPIIFYLLLREASLDEDGLFRLVDALILAALLVSLYGLYQFFFTGDVITAEGVRRIRGVYGSPNNLGLFLGRVVPLAIAFILFGRFRGRRWGYLLATVPILLCLYLTHSRGAWLLGVPVALLFIGLMRGKRGVLIALAGVVGAFLALLPLAGLQRITSLFDLSGETVFRRLKLWEATLAMIRDHPLFGVGLDNFLYHYPRYMLPEAWQEPDLSHPHNILLDWWTRLGVVGVGVLIWLEVSFFRLGLRLYRSLEEGELRALALGLMASMVDFLAHGLIDNSYFLVDLAFVFFLTLGLMRRLSLPAQQKAVGGK
jgi:O-antigen ligase